MFGDERCCQRKKLLNLEAGDARRNPPQSRLKPRRRGAEARTQQAHRASEGDHLSRGNWTPRGLGGFAARSPLRSPPHPARIGNHRASPHFIPGVVNGAADGHDIGADCACRNMRAQISIHPPGPAGLDDGGQGLRFEFALKTASLFPPVRSHGPTTPPAFVVRETAWVSSWPGADPANPRSPGGKHPRHTPAKSSPVRAA